jgi:large exoprotein involved in heme utilization and adhesion
VHASDIVDVNGSGPVPGTFSRINSGTFGFGNAGNILIQSPRLTINHGTIRAQSEQQASANAGSIDINVGTLKIINGEGILTTSVGSGGDIVINASRSIEISESRGISSQAFGNGKAGNISITTPTLSIDGGGGCGNCGIPSGIDASTSSKGDAGNIVLNINKLTMENGGQITSSSLQGGLSTGNAGTITLQGSNGSGTAATSVGLDNSTISATSVASNGGTIHIEANKVALTDSQLTTSVSGGPQTVGGHITVDAKNVTLKNSQILSTATEGQGGTIDITSHVPHQDASSVIDASSQFGTDGTVTIH